MRSARNEVLHTIWWKFIEVSISLNLKSYKSSILWWDAGDPVIPKVTAGVKGRRDSSRDKLCLLSNGRTLKGNLMHPYASISHNLLARRLISGLILQDQGASLFPCQGISLLNKSYSSEKFPLFEPPKDFPCNLQTLIPVLAQGQTVKFQKTLTLSDKSFQTAIIQDSS